MKKNKCAECGIEFFCNGDKICRNMKYTTCYCEKCTRKARLDKEKGIRECGYREIVKFT